MEDSQEDPVLLAAKLPLAEKVAHKHWKVREAAYRELADKFNVAPEDAKIYSDFAASLAKIARDSNAAAQQTGFDAISKFAETAPPPLIRRIAADVGKALAEKGMNGRPTNKKRAAQALIEFVGADCGDIIIQSFAATGFKSKTPKVVTATAETIREALETYGSSAIPVKCIASHFSTLFGHSTEQVRSAGKALAVELHLWIGEPARVVLKGAKEVIVKEVEGLFVENAKRGKPEPKKLTRAKENRKRVTGNDVDIAEDSDNSEVGEEEEELNLAEEIDLSEKLQGVSIEIEEGVKKGWYDAVDSKKWSARKEALDTAANIIGDLRLTPGPHQEIITRLRKILAKDSNIRVVASAANLITAMAHGMRKQFPAAAAKALTVDLLVRLKEKNKLFLDAVCAALDTLHLRKCIRIVDMRDEIAVAAGKKSPKARVALLHWLSRCFTKGIPSADMKGPVLKSFGTLLVKATEDSSGEVRDAALSAISALQVLAGDRNVAQFLDKLDQKRKDKVAAGVTKLLEAREAEAAENPSKKPVKKVERQKKSGAGKGASTGTSSLAGESNNKGSRKSPPKTKEVPVVYVSDDEGVSPVEPDSALQAVIERYPNFEAESWSAKSAKARAASMKSLNDAVKDVEQFSEDDVNLLLSLLVREPGLQDSSFMVVKEKLEMLGALAERCTRPMPRKTLCALLVTAIEKLGDMKCAMVAAKVLIFVAEATSARFFFEVLSQVARDTLNGRAKVGIVKFASKVVDDFGIPAVKPDAVAALVVALSANAAPALQKACVTLACQCSVRSTSSFKAVLQSAGLGSDVMESFEAELTKYQTAPDPPTRKRRQFSGAPNVTDATSLPTNNAAQGKIHDTPVESKSKSPVAESSDGNSNLSEAQGPPVTEEKQAPSALIRSSIADHFAPGSIILKNLKSSNWNERQAALGAIDAIVAEANSFIDPNVGTEIVPVLKFRLKDSNRNIAAVAHGVASRLMKAMGPGAVVHLKILVPTILGQGCVDIKKNVRAAAMQSIEVWFETVGLSPLIPYLHLPLASLNSSFRKEFLEWLAPRLRGEVGTFSAKDEDLTPLLDSCLACLRDRVAEVRQLADVVMQPVLASVGLAAVENKLSSMTKSARMQLEPIIARHAVGVSEGHDQGEGQRTPARASLRTPGHQPGGRFGRERPQSVALPSPRTPAGRRGGDFTEGPMSSARRRRPQSTRVPSSASPFGSTLPSRDSGPVLKPNTSRASRAQRYLEKRKRNAEMAVDGGLDAVESTAEDPDDLAADLKECVSQPLYEKLTAAANRFQLHIEAMSTIKTCMSESPEDLVSVADVVLRWAACRIEDSRTPPTVLSKIAEFISSMCEVLLSSGVKVSEYEASALIPAIVGKIGSNRDSVRKSMLACLLSIGDVIPEDIMLIFLSGSLRRPLGDRACEEVAAEICQLIDRKCSSGAGLPVGVLPMIAAVTYGPDEIAGRAAASCISRAHHHFGDDLWGLLGNLTDDQALLIEERLTHANAAQTVERGSSLGTPRASPMSSPMQQQKVSVSSDAPRIPNLSDIRTEDFRLSVAPEPPSSVLSSIKDVLTSSTPAKTRRQFGVGVAVPPTPALPDRSKPFVPVFPPSVDILKYVLDQLKNEDRNAQQDGLAALYNDLQQTDSKLRHEPSTIMPNLSRCFSDALGRLEKSRGSKDDPLILKRFLNAIMAFAREPEVVVKLDQPGMESLLNDLLNAMVPEKVKNVEDWSQVRRGVNLVTLKVLEACDQNLLFTSLINVLRSGIRESANLQDAEGKARISSKCTFCIKSIAKATQKGYSDCNIDGLLRDIHEFLTTNPVLPHKNEVTEEQTIAIRLLKTIVDSIILEIGVNIRNCFSLIRNAESSQLARYVEMKLTDGSIPLPSVEDSTADRNATPSPDTKTSAQGHFAEGNGSPTTSQVGLRKVRIPPRPKTSTASAASAHGSGQVYLKRLHEIQQRYGLQSVSSEHTEIAAPKSEPLPSNARDEAEKHSSSDSSKKENGMKRITGSGAHEDTLSKASALRDRMARLRESRSQSSS